MRNALVVVLVLGCLGGLLLWSQRENIPQVIMQSEGATTTPSTQPLSSASTTAPRGGTTTSSVSAAPSAQTTAPAPVTPTTAAYKKAITTIFWVGESADASNAYISNDESYWDEQWQTHFGGYDDPDNRCGYNPCGFTPKENPFYVALPYGEYAEGGGSRKASAAQVPWYSATNPTLLKNRWVEVVFDGRICYGQWEDVGPLDEDDFAYVFGSATVPRNTFSEKAGLDVSPALAQCLEITEISGAEAVTSWRFVDAAEVPAGPWKNIVTTSGVFWE